MPHSLICKVITFINTCDVFVRFMGGSNYKYLMQGLAHNKPTINASYADRQKIQSTWNLNGSM